MVDIDKCKITHYPAKVLASRALPVEKIDEDIKKLVDKMIDIMVELKGVGLAAPQAGVNLRLFIISLDGTRENVRVYINPTVVVDGDAENMEEGCLSVPGINTKIKRYTKATVTATDLDGKKFTEEADELYAHALQHEYDHIEGITIVSKMTRTAKIIHRKKIKELIEKTAE